MSSIVRNRRSRLLRAAARVAALALVAGALPGCLGAKSPEFRVTGVRVAEDTADGAVLVFSLEGDNRNAQALPLRDIRYEVSLGDGETRFSAHRIAQATLPPLGVGEFELPAALGADAAAALTNGQRRYRLSASVTYVPPGAFAKALFNASIHRPSAAFTQEGRLDFDRTPADQPPGASGEATDAR